MIEGTPKYVPENKGATGHLTERLANTTESAELCNLADEGNKQSMLRRL
jgi:hypothetical protein